MEELEKFGDSRDVGEASRSLYRESFPKFRWDGKMRLFAKRGYCEVLTLYCATVTVVVLRKAEAGSSFFLGTRHALWDALPEPTAGGL